MKRKLLALLCVWILCVPGLCASEMTGVSYPCDADGCGYEGPFSIAVTGTETRDGAPGEWYTVQCPQCGTPLMTSWRQTGPAAQPEPTAPPVTNPPVTNPPATNPPATQPPVTAPPPTEQPVTAPPATDPPTQKPQEDPKPAEPEAPVTVPPATVPPAADSPAVLPPVPPESAPPAPAQTLPPAIPEPPASGGGAAVSPQEPAAPEAAAEHRPETAPAGSGGQQKRRNLQKYPYFSSLYPSRRLNLEGDPEAWAPIPGTRIYPPEGSSILQHMLDGGN